MIVQTVTQVALLEDDGVVVGDCYLSSMMSARKSAMMFPRRICAENQGSRMIQKSSINIQGAPINLLRTALLSATGGMRSPQ